MSGHRPFADLAKSCESCSTLMPLRSVRSFTDDGTTRYVCRDTEACEARRAGRFVRGEAATIREARDLVARVLANLHESWQDLGRPDQYQGLVEWLNRVDQILDQIEAVPERAGTPEGFKLRLMHLTKRIQDLEAWRRASERPAPKRPGLNWDAAGEDDPT